MPAEYLLRIDDLCPTVHRENWSALRQLIGRHALQPILAVVPANGDPELMIAEPDACFWTDLQTLERQGAAIALHGYRHVCASHGRSLLPLHRASEFAGICEGTQHGWIREGMQILLVHGLHPEIWVAPRHGSDVRTIRALQRAGIRLISDGLTQKPVRRKGLVWIPQQLWSPSAKSSGLWTICVHPNTMTAADLDLLDSFVQEHASSFTSVARVRQEWRVEEISGLDLIREGLSIAKIRARRRLRGLVS